MARKQKASTPAGPSSGVKKAKTSASKQLATGTEKKAKVADIDDIFAKPAAASSSKAASTAAAGAASSSSSSTALKKKKKAKAIAAFIPDDDVAESVPARGPSAVSSASAEKGEKSDKKKKRKSELANGTSHEPKTGKTVEPVSQVEEVLDPELAAVQAAIKAEKARKAAAAAGGTSKGKEKGKTIPAKRERSTKEMEADMDFADSRGTGPSQFSHLLGDQFSLGLRVVQ